MSGNDDRYDDREKEMSKKNDLVFPGHDSIVNPLDPRLGTARSQCQPGFKLAVLSSGGLGRSLQSGHRGDLNVPLPWHL